MTKVYRVEHRTSRRGPWSHPIHKSTEEQIREYDLMLSALEYTNNSGTHESIVADCAGEFVESYFCGVLDDDLICYWFNDDVLLRLHRLDFVLRVYDVPDNQIVLTKSMTQVAFYYESSDDPVETIELVELL